MGSSDEKLQDDNRRNVIRKHGKVECTVRERGERSMEINFKGLKGRKR